MNFKLAKTDLLVYSLLFVLLAVFLIHSFDSIGQDIGRHLKVGEIIWQTKEVPKTNLFSFTEPDFAFINHHWLSEVIFFGIFSLTGFAGLILVKTFFILLAFLLLLSIARKHAKFWPLAISFLLSIFIFIQRTEVRPEFFSFAILAFFLWVLFKAKYAPRFDLKNPQGRTLNWLWFLPLAQLFWVNLHIYFFIGPFLILAFFLDRLAAPRSDQSTRSDLVQVRGSTSDLQKGRTLANWKILLILVLVGLATLVNPAGIHGALLPFNILKEYGYSIVENQTLSFLAHFFGFTWPIFLFKTSTVVLAAAFLLAIKKARQRVFEIIISVFFIYAGFKMLRNLPLYALASFPVLAILLTDLFNQGSTFLKTQGRTLKAGQGSTLRPVPRSNLRNLSMVFKILFSIFLIIMIGSVISGFFYRQTHSAKAFGFSVPNGLERAVDFVKENKIEGPVFNYFDIGGYLIWQIEGVRYPVEKVPDPFRVFVDNRPEAYPVKFFSEVYKPMQEDKEKWAEFSEKYGINFIFFGHTDATPWGQSFLKSIINDLQWVMVYLNESAVIFVKNNAKNSEIIFRFSLLPKNVVEKATGDPLVLSRFSYNINWQEASLYFAQEAIKLDSQNPQPYLIKGLAHAYYTDKENQKLAAENLKTAIDLGLKESRYYYILGVIKMNLGQLSEAKNLFIKALERDKNNRQAREFLEKYFSSH